jgi:CRISPR-associated endonuclease/helicase Cas3
MLEENLVGGLGGTLLRLVHSRFIAADRLNNDAELLRLLGPDVSNRPQKLIVVGTQVMEQSLDIDFDVMITDVAPVDLLLQRMGRLHRHARGEEQCARPPKLRRARCYIVGVEDWSANPPSFSRGINKVYQEALLLRTILVLRDKTDSKGELIVNLPHDIANLVESVYADRDRAADEMTIPLDIPDTWQSKFDEAERRLAKRQTDAANSAKTWLLGKPQSHSSKNLVGWLRESLTIADENVGRAAVRDSQESIEVIAVQECDGGLCVFPWVQ